MRMSSLFTAVSGLNGAQAGLYVAGHNLANSESTGYTRQRVLYRDESYLAVGEGNMGKMQVGLGSAVESISNIRDRFLDASYRVENSKLAFYSQKSYVGREMETIFGELQSDYNAWSVFDDMWRALDELSTYPAGLENRGNFFNMCNTLITKAQNIYDRLVDTQYDLDRQVREQVMQTNHLISEIKSLNSIISASEISGDNANDHRDTRNLALDKLSGIMGIRYREKIDGTVDVFTSEGDQLLVNGMQHNIGLKYTSSEFPFVEPIFTQSTSILPSDATPGSYRPLFTLIGKVDALNKNDAGSLKSLLVSRGTRAINYSDNRENLGVRPTSSDIDEVTGDPKYPGGINDVQLRIDILEYEKELFNMEQAFIPRTQKEFDKLFNAIVEMLNDAFAPEAGYTIDGDGNRIPNAEGTPFGLNGAQFTELFVRNLESYPRYDENGQYIEPDPNDFYSLYSIGNVKINPLFSQASGYNLLAVSKDGDADNNQIILDVLDIWKSGFIETGRPGALNVDQYYRHFMNGLASETDKATKFTDSQVGLIVEIDNKRKTISGVATDEELTFIMKFQHTYNANSRILNMIDSLIDTVVNGTGRVGR